nr:hypothetical protein [Tanacetum cinerariifolium]
MRSYDYGYLEEIVVRRDDNVLYKFKERDFPRLNLCDIEDMLLLLVQKKLSNLDVDDWYDLGVALRMFTRRIVNLHRVEDLHLGVESYQKKLNITRPVTTRSNISKLTPYTAYKNPQVIIYQDKLRKNTTQSTQISKINDLIGKIIPCNDLSSRNVLALSAKCPGERKPRKEQNRIKTGQKTGSVKCSHWQYKFPLPVKVVATARRLEMPLLEVCTAIEEKKKKLSVKDRWQLH